MQQFLDFALAGSAALNCFLLARGYRRASEVETLTTSLDLASRRGVNLADQVEALSIALRNANEDRARLSAQLTDRQVAEQRRHAVQSVAVGKGNRTRLRNRLAKLTPATEGAVKVGTHLVADGGFTCIKAGAELVVSEKDGGLIVPCRDGGHDLAGQLDEGSTYIGLYLAPVAAA